MIKERVDEYCMESGLAPVEIGKSWINSQSENGYVASHRHELSIVSGAFYPIVEPGSAPLVFDSPIKGPRMSEIHNVATHFTSDTMEFDPRDGMLILFPSWLYHYSLPNKTAKRITISFNTFHIYMNGSINWNSNYKVLNLKKIIYEKLKFQKDN